jgi:hypothetical protein
MFRRTLGDANDKRMKDARHRDDAHAGALSRP